MPDLLPRLPPMLAPEREATWPLAAGIAAAALVETAQGPRPAASLLPGTLLRGADGQLHMLRRRWMLGAASTEVVTIGRDAIAGGVPARPLAVCRGQPLLLGDAVWPAGFLEDGNGVAAGPTGLPCVQLETDGPCVLLVEGLACVSHQPSGRPLPDAGLARLRALIATRGGRRYGRLEGTVERLGPEGAEGWVRDAAMPGVPVLLALLSDGHTVAHGFADLARPDLAMVGLGACAFRIDANLPQGGMHVLELRRAEDGERLPGGMALQLPMPGDPDVPAMSSVVADALVGLTRARLRRAPSGPR
ncbi:MAG: Hint domain-containing protein [Rhodospirillales bacterium]|nr:Hint domain-containing protein [Rhodospirillales bacterium]